MLNAAFLLEQGECLGMNRIDCAKASVRLWKAAATRGYSEASLRVGDVYYYGRFRKGENESVGPFGWIRYVVYPEVLFQKGFHYIRELTRRLKSTFQQTDYASEDTGNDKNSAVCMVDDNDGTCVASFVVDDSEHTVEKDLSSAALYYRLAAEGNTSPRAHFNLGFLYEWGLGLKQDFPLAKRHYDLARTINAEEAEVPVTLALISLSAHEYVVKKWMMWSASGSPLEGDERAPVDAAKNVGGRIDWEVILERLFVGDLLVILALTVVLRLLFLIRP
jgi:TPR repeat protein